MVWLKYHLALPGNKIKDLFFDLCGLKVSEGAIAQALQRLSRYLELERAQILQALRRAGHKHVDETGWNINGVSHWLWSLAHPKWAYFLIHKSRGSRVPKELLGAPHQGIVVSDFFGAYNKLSGSKQKCLVHLKRDIRNARGADPPPDFRRPEKTFRRLLADADRLAVRRGSLPPLVFARRARRLKARLFDFACQDYSHKFWQRISARLLKHYNELFTFLDVPGLPSDNNTAERAIRPHVIIRNRSFQNRTDKGAHAHGTLTSLLQTLHLQKRPIVPALAHAYLHHRQGLPNLSLFSSTG
jgi:hypothetical protein